MPYVPSNQHTKRVHSAIESRNAPLNNESSRLVSSWQRSLERYRLDPSSRVGPRVVTASELRELREREEAFLRASGQCLTRLHETVRTTDYCVLLTNAHGVTIDYRIDRDRRADFKHAGLHIGSCWSEQEEGTCGIANVLADLAPITVHKTDHFRAAFTTLTCSAAPIFAPDGCLIGVLDASAVRSPDNRDSQRLIYQLVRQNARLIEDAYFLNQTTHHWILFGHLNRHFVEMWPEVLIAFDEGGNLVAANAHARETIPGLTGDARGHLADLFDVPLARILDASNLHDVLPLRLCASGTLLYARIRRPQRRGHAAGILTSARAARPVASARLASPLRGVLTPDHWAPDPSGMSAGRLSDSPAGAGPLRAFAQSQDRRVAQAASIALRVAQRRLPIMILGESGCGKEVFARAIHESGLRCQQPFVAVNCGALPESLIESELFGYAAGAFTGARSKGTRGKIALAHGGTLFLDEIGDMPLSLQTRLLRVLADGEILPLGAETATRVDVNVICATHRDLDAMVAQRTFREDLYYRLCGAVLRLPPLRERTDIRELIQAVFDDEARAVPHRLVLDPAMLERLCHHPWPGNVRQLRHALRYACAVADTNRVEWRHLPAEIASELGSSATPPVALASLTDERERIVAALTRNQWRPIPAAQALGISRATLYRRIAKLGIVPPHRLPAA
ncbi:sigma-54-dependent Fis family transcriptional regulator [Mycetohabitans sp. B8]|uniref:sigma-54-dependent Fis family transcriptional regulator n=1 Tax=Mycetohabitans sp. B8 TaxID=2841845 RepID=UPI001F3E3956|nr:sigma-54-dependent Fis family transcriptional regulator [Mycetohabitans sp. B8]MCG1042811.1 sigma-54-dependent Fis family transcriptional regulator [Mycetohabitans sp. B8]